MKVRPMLELPPLFRGPPSWPKGEAGLRDALAAELRTRGWKASTEYLARGYGRIDIHAVRRDETRVIECKIVNLLSGVGQVLGYVVALGVAAIPTLAVPPSGDDPTIREVCRRAGVDLWIEGIDWHKNLDLAHDGFFQMIRAHGRTA